MKVLIFGVPMCKPSVRAVISCPMSGPASAGHGSHWGGPEGTLPPAGDSGTGVGCLSGPHLPPPRKVTSWSSSLGSLLPNGHTQSLGVGVAGEVQSIHAAWSPAWDLLRAVRAHCHWGLQAWHGDNAEFPHLEELVGEELQLSLPCCWIQTPHQGKCGNMCL